MSDFPPAGMVSGQDSARHTVEHADPAMRAVTDGGYEMTRARYTRAPRKTFTTGYTSIKDADKALLEAFWQAHQGGSLAFTWTDLTTGVEETVRFTEQALKFNYVGRGNSHRWDIDLSIKQV